MLPHYGTALRETAWCSGFVWYDHESCQTMSIRRKLNALARTLLDITRGEDKEAKSKDHTGEPKAHGHDGITIEEIDPDALATYLSDLLDQEVPHARFTHDPSPDHKGPGYVMRMDLPGTRPLWCMYQLTLDPKGWVSTCARDALAHHVHAKA